MTIKAPKKQRREGAYLPRQRLCTTHLNSTLCLTERKHLSEVEHKRKKGMFSIILGVLARAIKQKK